jgi:uncharacterized membrane protein
MPLEDDTRTGGGAHRSSSVAFPWGRGVQWVREGARMFVKAPGVWMLLVVLQLLIWVAISLLPTPEGLLGAVFDLVIQIGGIIVGIFLDAGLLLGCASQQRGERLQIGTLTAAIGHPAAPALIRLALLQVLAWFVVTAVVVAMVLGLLLGGAWAGIGTQAISDAVSHSLASVLLIVLVAGTFGVLLAMAMWMSAPLVVFRGLTPMQALVASFHANLRNVGALTIYGLIMIGLLVVAAIPLFVGLLAWIPLAMTSRYLAFVDLFPETDPKPAGETTTF